VELQGIVLRREVGTGPGFDLAVERAEADVDLWSLLSAEPRIELARVDGVTGFVSPPARDGSPERTEGAERPVRAKRAFRADLAQVSALDIEIRPAGGTPYALRIDKAEVAPFRSRVALFDLLFRSNLQAEIAGQPLLVETRDITEFGRETRWRFEDVEAARLKLIVAKAPLTWLDSGTFSAVVDDRWSLSEDWVDMDWRITLADVSINAPENAKAGEKVLAGALKKLVAARGGNASFGYRLRLDQNEIRNLRSGDLDQFWDVVLSGVLAGGAHGADEAGGPDVSEETPGRLRGALDRMRSLLGDGDK
jgi:hypothetical protein